MASRAVSRPAHLTASLMAQEIGEADIGFQQYYLNMGSHRVTNVSGLRSVTVT